MLNPELVKLQIDNLKVLYPDLLEDEEAWLLTIESETDLDQILRQIVRAIDDAAAMEAGTKERMQVLTERKDRFSRKQKAMRELIFKLMSGADIQKREYPEATLSIGKGQQQLIGDANPKELPDEFCKITREVDRTRIKAALKAGEAVTGFSLSNAQPTLTIRTK